MMKCLISVEEPLGRTSNPTLYTLADWRAKKAAGNSFVLKVEEQEQDQSDRPQAGRGGKWQPG